MSYILMKYNIYTKRWTKPQGRRVCGEQTGWYGCATVIGKSRCPGADNGAFGAQRMSGALLDGGLGYRRDNEWHCQRAAPEAA